MMVHFEKLDKELKIKKKKFSLYQRKSASLPFLFEE